MREQVWIITFLIMALPLTPSLTYLFWGRPYRRRMILSYFAPGSIAGYIDQFWAGSGDYSASAMKYRHAVQGLTPPTADETHRKALLKDKEEAAKALTQALEELYNKRFGWFSYFLPFAAFALVLLLEARIVAEFVGYFLSRNAFTATDRPVPVEVANAVRQLPDKIAVAALAGAYLSVGLDLLRRASSLTLLPSDFGNYALRMTVAPILGFAVSTVAGNADTAVLVAFTITLLPIAEIITWLRSMSARNLNVPNAAEAEPDRLLNLPGVDSTIAGRLQDQGISTILQLCDTDPVQLSMRTGLDFAFVVELVDEALAWCYFGEKLRLLRMYGWSAASDIEAAYHDPKATVEDAAFQFTKAKAELEASSAPSHGASSDEVQASRDKAGRAFDAARKKLTHAVGASVDDALVTAIVNSSGSKLSAPGIQNIVRRIHSDNYARFIRELMSEVDSQSAPLKEPRTFVGRIKTAIQCIRKSFR